MVMWQKECRSCAGVRPLTAPQGRRRGPPKMPSSWPGACEITGQIQEAMAQLDLALQIVERTGVRWLEAELYRHKGQLLLRQGHSEAAEKTISQSPQHRPGAGGQALGI